MSRSVPSSVYISTDGSIVRLVNAAAAFLAALALLAGAAAGASAQNGPARLLVIGDSLSSGYGLPPERGLIAQLEEALAETGREVVLLDGAVSGDTSAGALARLDWALFDEPDAVLLQIGSNDALRGVDPASTRANIEAILERLAAEEIPVLLAGMLAPRNLGPEYAEAFDGLYPELAEAYDVPLYPFFLEGVALEPGLNQPDGMHPNAAGVAVIVDRILPAVIALLETASGEPHPWSSGCSGEPTSGSRPSASEP